MRATWKYLQIKVCEFDIIFIICTTTHMLHSYIYIATYLPRAAPFFHWKTWHCRDRHPGIPVGLPKCTECDTSKPTALYEDIPSESCCSTCNRKKKFNKIAAILLQVWRHLTSWPTLCWRSQKKKYSTSSILIHSTFTPYLLTPRYLHLLCTWEKWIWKSHHFSHVTTIACLPPMNAPQMRLQWGKEPQWHDSKLEKSCHAKADKQPRPKCSGTSRSPCSDDCSTSPSWNLTNPASNWRSQHRSHRFGLPHVQHLLQKRECEGGSCRARFLGIPCFCGHSTKTSCVQTIQSTSWSSLHGSRIERHGVCRKPPSSCTQYAVEMGLGHTGTGEPMALELACTPCGWQRQSSHDMLADA